MGEPYLTREQVEETINFAQEMWAGERFGWYSPYLSNTLLQGLNNNPKVPSSDSIEKSLASYMESANEIQSYTEFMTHWDMIFERTLYSYVNALAFDLIPICTNIPDKNSKEYEDYLKERAKVIDFLDKFDYKDNFRKVVINLMKNETYFTWLRKTKWGNQGMKYALQVLPQEYCMLTGYWEKGLLFNFNMAYFLQAGTDIDTYDPAFKKYYDRIFKDGKYYQDYIPTNQIGDMNGTYGMWTQVDPADGGFAFKFDTSNFNSTPFLAPFLRDTIRNSEIGKLQYNKDIASAYAILAGELRLFDTAKSGTQANQFAIDPKVVGQFMGKVRSGLDGAVKLAALPVENSKFFQYEDKNPSSYTDQLAVSAGVGSGISRVVYSSDRQSNTEVEAGLNEMYNTMKQIYPQFQNFLEFYIGQITKKYHWKFIFEGSNYPFERQKRFDNLTKLADKGIVMPPQVWAASIGYNPFDFERLIEESKNSGWTDNLQLMLNANTMKDGDIGGRPTIEGSVNDSTEASRNE